MDSNVLLDVLSEDPQWFDWSSNALAQSAESAPLVINPIIYAEVSIRFARIEELDEALPTELFRREPLPWAAGFLAGKCFQAYRQRGGAKRSSLPDLFIGAHAAINELTLLTRDGARYRTYFPRLNILAP